MRSVLAVGLATTTSTGPAGAITSDRFIGQVIHCGQQPIANQWWDSGTMSFQYDASGNMTQIQDVSRGSTWSLSYDESNRVMSKQAPAGRSFDSPSSLTAPPQRFTA